MQSLLKNKNKSVFTSIYLSKNTYELFNDFNFFVLCENTFFDFAQKKQTKTN